MEVTPHSAAVQPHRKSFPREHPADAARRDLDRRFWAGQAEMERLRAETWRDIQRQQDARTPEELWPEALRPRPSPMPAAR